MDTRGARCPVPVVRLARAVWANPAGTVVELWSDDPGSGSDVPAWCRMRGATLLAVRPVPDGSATSYLVRGAGPKAGGSGSAAPSSSR